MHCRRTGVSWERKRKGFPVLTSNKRITSLVVAFALASVGLLSPVQAARTPKNPAAVNDAQVLDQPITSSATTPRVAAEKHLATQGAGWGVDPAQFVFDSEVPITDTLTVVRFTQHYANSIFIGAIAALTVSTDGSLVSYTLKTGHAPSNARLLNESAAIQVAKAEFTAMYGVAASDIDVAQSQQAIADPDVTDYVSTSTWAWRVQLFRQGTLGTDTYVVSDDGKVISHSTDRKDAFVDPLVCDMQQLDTSFSATNPRAVQRGAITFKVTTKSPKKKLKEKKLTGVKNSKVWIVVSVDYINGVSSSIVSAKVKSGRLAVLTPTFTNIPNGKNYSVYVGTGKKQPAFTKFKLIKKGITSSSQIKLMGKLPTKTASLATAGISPNKFYAFVDINSTTPGLPICNYSNAAVTGAGDDALTASERVSTFNDIKGFRDFMLSSVSAGPDINAEKYLGNISPSLNFGSGATCAEGNEEGDCTPRISAFTNVCATYAGSLSCPQFNNAFWVPWRSNDCRSGVCSAIFIGRGFAANDVVAHELAHGVTGAIAFSSTSRSADAIAEAYSDFYGEAYDQLTPTAGEGDESLWPVGEDINIGSAHGPFRYVSAVGSGDIPVIDSCWQDNAEGHTNMGPYNRFVWLIVNGGDPQIAHPGCTANPSDGKGNITPLSLDKATSIKMMLDIVWVALPNLGSAGGGSTATYSDFALRVIQACATLYGETSAACTTVDNALMATGFPVI